MESSTFVTSKSFAKTLLSSCPSSSGRRSRVSVPRCSLKDEGAAADWRSFRAKLVAGARQGDWWAHRLHEPEKGCLLVATERLDGAHIFERAVVLLLSAGPIGHPTGVILNRPSLMSIKEAGPVAETDAFSGRRLFFGGPVEDGVFLLRGGGGAAAHSGAVAEVMDGLYYGTKDSVPRAGEMVKRGYVAAGDFRFFDGHCGWDGIRELRDEVRAGYWAVAACSVAVLEMDCARLWDDIVGLVWGKSVR